MRGQQLDIKRIKQKALSAISPLKAMESNTHDSEEFAFNAKRTEAGRKLPPYYLVYFLLVDLLGFKNLGQFEKVSWSVPVEYKEQAFIIEHRKFGLGVFAHSIPDDEKAATEIVGLINKAVKIAKPYFEWRAQQAAQDSKLNVVNRSRELFARYEFLREQYVSKAEEAERRKDERIETKIQVKVGNATSVEFPAPKLWRESRWLALSAIESFFSWTEHVFIHIAILKGACITGEDVADLAKAEWATKFKAALDIRDAHTKKFYDELAIVRRQLRNFVAHGSFGKDGEAFQFHSGAGAVPILLPHKRDRQSFRFGQGVNFESKDAMDLIERFVDHLWSEDRAPAKIYLQEYELPLILTEAKSGEYERAMSSVDDMTEYADYWAGFFDRHIDMDF